MRKNLIATLSPDELHSKVDESIGIAYSFLKPELKQLCVNLSHFPGKFKRESAVAIFDFNGNMLDMLVQRSLLQYERSLKQFYFHQMLKTFFIQINAGEDAEILQYHFSSQYQLYYAQLLQRAIPDDGTNIEFHIFNELHNIVHMVTLFISHKHINYTFFAIKVVSHPLRLRIFLKLLSPSIPLLFLESLDSYSTNERASVESFFETYIQVVILAAKSKSVKHAIQLLLAKRKEVDKGYKGGTLSPNMHTQFYVILGNGYNKIGDVEKSNRCYSKIVHKELGHCYPKCDYFSLSVAYENIGDKEQAFKFRKLAFHHKLSLAAMDKVRLLLYLYNDYMNTSLGNDVTKAEELSVEITQTVYTYLLNADRIEYSEKVYYMAIEFFRSQNMEENAISCDCETINIKKGEYFEWTRGLFLYPLDDPNYTTEIIRASVDALM